MAFEGLSEKLNAAFKKLRGKGRLTEADVREGMREVRLALLEADVSYKVVKDFVAQVTERCVGADVLDSLTPGQQIVKIVNEELTALMGGYLIGTQAGASPTMFFIVLAVHCAIIVGCGRHNPVNQCGGETAFSLHPPGEVSIPAIQKGEQ